MNRSEAVLLCAVDFASVTAMATSVTNEGKPLVDDYFGQSREPWVDANSEAFLRFHPATKRLRVAHSGYCSNTCDFGPPLLSSCSINNTSLTMYDMYHLLYPEYFRRVMQLPRGTRFLPPWKLGMRTSWSFSAARERASADRELLQGTRASAHKKRVSHGWAPARNEGLLLGEWCGRSNDTRYTIEERVPPVGSAYDVLTTTATMPLVAANKPSSPSQSGRQDMSTRPQWPVVPSRYASGTTAIRYAFQLTILFVFLLISSFASLMWHWRGKHSATLVVIQAFLFFTVLSRRFSWAVCRTIFHSY